MYKKIIPPKSLASNLLAIVIIVYIAYLLQDVIVPFIFSALFSFLLYPICQRLERWYIPRVLAITVSIILMLAFIVGLGYVAYIQIIKLEDLFPLVELKFNEWVMGFSKWAKINLGLNETQLVKEGQKYVADGVKTASRILGTTIGGTSSFIMNLFLMPLYIFLMLLYRDFLTTFMFKWLKDTSKHKIMLTINKVKEVIRSYIVGLILVIFIIGALNSASLYVIGIEHALFFGFFAAFLVIFPYIGVAIGSALPIIVALITKDSYLPALAVAAAFAVIQFLEGNFITPFVVGNQVSINSLVAITSLLLFGKIWGIAGMILALPVTAILKVIFDSSERLSAWGFLLGDAAHEDVRVNKKYYRFKDLTKKKI